MRQNELEELLIGWLLLPFKVSSRLWAIIIKAGARN